MLRSGRPKPKSTWQWTACVPSGLDWAEALDTRPPSWTTQIRFPRMRPVSRACGRFRRTRGHEDAWGSENCQKHAHPDFSFDTQGRLIAAEAAIEMLRAA
eukprot:1879121-Prymnesium_polylepis.1